MDGGFVREARLAKMYLVINYAGKQILSFTVYFNVIPINLRNSRCDSFDAFSGNQHVGHFYLIFVDELNVRNEVVLHLLKLNRKHPMQYNQERPKPMEGLFKISFVAFILFPVIGLAQT